MKIKLLSLFLAVGIFAMGTSVMAEEAENASRIEAAQVTLKIQDRACEVIIDHAPNACTALCGSNKDPQKIGTCIKAITDPTLKAAIKAGLRSDCGQGTAPICSKLTCKKLPLGYGGDTNCKAICCASGNGDVLTTCCAAAGDKTCCGPQ